MEEPKEMEQPMEKEEQNELEEPQIRGRTKSLSKRNTSSTAQLICEPYYESNNNINND